MLISFEISEKQRKVLTSRYPSVKFFIKKAISNYMEKIIAEEETGKELKEYHERRVLNGYDFHKRKMTQATKDKISKALKATSKRQGWKGMHLDEETKKKIGLAHKGKILSQETKDAIGRGNKGKKRTEQQRQNISKSKTGQKYKKRKVKIK